MTLRATDEFCQDDLWRRNHDAIKSLQLHAPDFDPHYPTSIAYHPLPRPALEAFLAQRGLFHIVTQWQDFFHSGFLNKLYLRLNEAVFRGSSKVRKSTTHMLRLPENYCAGHHVSHG
jgi:hypothetical protein